MHWTVESTRLTCAVNHDSKMDREIRIMHKITFLFGDLCDLLSFQTLLLKSYSKEITENGNWNFHQMGENQKLDFENK